MGVIEIKGEQFMAYRVGIRKFANIIKTLGPDAKKAIIRGLQSTALQTEKIIVNNIENAKPYPAVNTGELKNSVNTKMFPIGAIVSINAPHASFMEHGTRPHFPPLGPMMNWVRQKGIVSGEKEIKKVAFLISKSISIHGIKPRFFVKKSIQSLYKRKILDKEINRELNILSSRRSS
jgi:hypothetical protein